MAAIRSHNLRDIALKLLDEIANERGRNEENALVPSNKLLSALHSVFPQTLQQALDLIDRGCITKVISPSGRDLYQVKGSSQKIYNCLMSSEFCTCPSYTYYGFGFNMAFFSFTLRPNHHAHLECKHVLAVYIARNLETYNEKEISDEDLAKILKAVNG